MSRPRANDLDPIELSQRLIRCPSVTPKDAGALDVLQKFLTDQGFACHRLPFEGDGEERVDNLYARLGTGQPNFCFAGHTDVVPTGDETTWTIPPFEATIKDDRLYGRGAADMKAAVAAFAVAAIKFVSAQPKSFKGSISLLITGDEEGVAVNGTAKVLKWMAAKGEKIDACLVGEPTNPSQLGDMVKIGRRGSLTGTVTVHGTQGHSAYPQLADNPIHRLMAMLTAIVRAPLDQGSEHFQPTVAVVTTIDVGNPAGNVIPGRAFARFNIRFNNLHTGESLRRLIRERFDAVGGRYDLDIKVSGEAFLTPAGRLSDVVTAAVERVTGRKPELSTTGGTSDARFIKDYCPVAEFGLIGQTMHKVDEHVRLADIHALVAIYEAVLEGYFAGPAS